jgi:hypothetical protein
VVIAGITAASVAAFVPTWRDASALPDAVKTVWVARPHVWEGLSQPEVDALTQALAGIEKHPVAIFCQHGCDDLALDFDNAFESAHWESGIEHPLIDDNVGLNVAPISEAGAALAHAIAQATHGRLTPRLIDAQIGDRLAVVISRKPR